MYLLSFPRFWTLSVDWFWFLFWSYLNGVTLKTSNTAFGFPVIQLCNGPFARNCHTWNKKTLLDGKRRRGAGKTEATYFIKLIPFLFKVPLTCLPSSKVGFVPVPVLCKGPNSFPRQYPWIIFAALIPTLNISLLFFPPPTPHPRSRASVVSKIWAND